MQQRPLFTPARLTRALCCLIFIENNYRVKHAHPADFRQWTWRWKANDEQNK